MYFCTRVRRSIGVTAAEARNSELRRWALHLFDQVSPHACELRSRQRAFELKVLRGRVLRLHRERWRAGVGHQIHAGWPACGWIGCRWQTALGDERTDSEALVGRVFRVRDRTWSAEHRDRGIRALEAVGAMHIAAARIADDLDGELGIDLGAVRIARWPRQRDADQAALEQQRVRPRVVGWQIRAVHPVHRRKQRILAASGRPALPDGAHRK